MKIEYEDLGPDQFERLIVCLCQELFGLGVQNFSKGRDGGRDAKFIGTAQKFPSKIDSWCGVTIIQAKHTNGYNANCSSPDFFSIKNSNSIIGQELPKIEKLRAAGELDNYILFTNRRLSANKSTEISNCISSSCGLSIDNVHLCGVETLDMLLHKFPHVIKQAAIDPVDFPLNLSPYELAEIIESLATNFIDTAADVLPVDRVYYENKNSINNMTPEYANLIRKRYLKYTDQIQEFLSNPQNYVLLNKYMLTIEEFQEKIIAKRKNYQSFDEVMNYMVDFLINRDYVLKKNIRLTKAMLFYMYWNCDIGETSDVSTN